MAHAHTLFSGDGELSPQQLADLARGQGFAGVLVADHFESLSPERFAELRRACGAVTGCLLAPGYERSWDGYHVLALGVDAWFDDPDLDVWAGKVRGAGGITVLAHPSRYGHRVPAAVLASCGSRRYPLCGQDVHGRRHVSSVALHLPTPCASWQEILECMKHGEYTLGNRLWRFDKRLSGPAALALAVFHRGRRSAVNSAIRLRRFVRTARRLGWTRGQHA